MLQCIFVFNAGSFHVRLDEKSVVSPAGHFFYINNLRHISTAYLLLRILRSKSHAESESLKGDFEILAHKYEDRMTMQTA